MKQIKILTTSAILAVLACLVAACTEEAAPVKLKETLLCEGNEGVTPFKVNCTYFYLDEYNNEVEPADTVYWTLDIALEGIAQRFYSESTGNRFFTEIDRPGEYTLTAANSGNKTSILVSIVDPQAAPKSLKRHVPVRIASGQPGRQERILEATPGYEITSATIQVHPNSSRVSSRVLLSSDATTAKLIVELQPKAKTFKVKRAWFAGNVVLTERKI